MKATLEAWLDANVLEKHSLLQGASGSGKTTELVAMCLSIIRATNSKSNPASVVVIEPHSHLCRQIMASRIPDERLIYVSTTIQSESGHKGITPIFNPFQLPPGANEAFKHTLAAQLANTISEMVETSQNNITINMHMILLPAILVTLSSPNPCMTTLRKLLNNDAELYQLGLSYPHEQIQDFFLNHWKSKDYDLTKRALISKVNYILNDVTLYNMMNGNGINIEKCLDEGKVLIINAPVGANPFAANIVGRLMIAYIFSILLRRIDSTKKPVPCYMFIDEMNSYASSTLGDMLRQSRKFGCRLILSGQSLKGLPPALKGACLTNTFLKLVSIADSETRTLMAKEMGISTDELAKVEPMMFMVSRNDGGKTKPFRVRVPRLNSHVFLSEKEIQQRLAYQIQHTGVYKQLPPPPPPATPNASEQQTKKTSKSKDKGDGFSAMPAFNS